MHSAGGTLAAVPPFDFAKTLRFVNDFTPAAGEQTVTDRYGPYQGYWRYYLRTAKLC